MLNPKKVLKSIEVSFLNKKSLFFLNLIYKGLEYFFSPASDTNISCILFVFCMQLPAGR